MQDRKEVLKGIIRSLHEGSAVEDVKERFSELLRDVPATEIAEIEEELIREGMAREEVHRLCDVHLAVFQESLESQQYLAPAGHPVHILMAEHDALLRIGAALEAAAGKLGSAPPADELVQQLARLEDDLRNSANHYLREENVLFPYIEKHGLTQPPAIMWMEHDQIRELERGLYGLLESRAEMAPAEFASELVKAARGLHTMLDDHFRKENTVLFPAGLRLLTEDEWVSARAQFDELGYCPFTPEAALAPFGASGAAAAAEPEAGGAIRFPTGAFSVEELDAMLNTLPVEITFVDANDRVRYFNQTEERIFPRAVAAIGREVQLCHPQKSVHLVNKILEEFRSGERDVAEFWIQMGGKFVHIRYFAVRDAEGAYLGSLETVQELSHLRALDGERRLLDGEG